MGLYIPGQVTATTSSTANWGNCSLMDVKSALKRAVEAFEKLKGLPKPEFDLIVITKEAFDRYLSEHCDTRIPDDATGFESTVYGVPIWVFNTNEIATTQAYVESVAKAKRVLLFTIDSGKPHLRILNGPRIAEEFEAKDSRCMLPGVGPLSVCD
jgi:hypothetical protein